MSELWLQAQLLHPWPSLATSLAAVGFGLVFGIRPTDWRIAIVFVTVLMTQLSISALNEWADRDRDALAHRRRPVATGLVSPKIALALAIVFGICALPGALLFGTSSTVILLLGLAAGWSYDLVLKPTPLSFVPFAMAFPLLVVWVSIAAGRPLHSWVFLFLGGSPLAIAIHLADGIPDRLADAASRLRTLSVVLRRPVGEIVATLLVVFGIAVLYVVLWQRGRLTLALGSPLSLALIYLVLSIGRSTQPPLARQLAKWVLIFDAAAVGLMLALVAAYG